MRPLVPATRKVFFALGPSLQQRGGQSRYSWDTRPARSAAAGGFGPCGRLSDGLGSQPRHPWTGSTAPMARPHREPTCAHLLSGRSDAPMGGNRRPIRRMNSMTSAQTRGLLSRCCGGVSTTDRTASPEAGFPNRPLHQPAPTRRTWNRHGTLANYRRSSVVPVESAARAASQRRRPDLLPTRQLGTGPHCPAAAPNSCLPVSLPTVYRLVVVNCVVFS